MSKLPFVSQLRERCRANPGRLALPESEDPRMLAAATRLLGEGAVSEVLLFTPEAATYALAAKHAVDLGAFKSRLAFIDFQTAGAASPLIYAAELLQAGVADAVLAGSIATTANVIRAGISGVGLAAGVRTVSGSFIMNKELPGEQATFLYADAGVVIAPTVKQLVDIAIESVKTWECIVGTEPVVAFLSYSTKGSAPHESSEKMAEAAAAFRERRPDVSSDGELQFDAALLADIGSRKAPGSAVPGRANCFIFPDLGAGNIAYKITQRLAGFEAYGPILQGLAKPYSDLSRGSTVNDIVASAYISLLRRCL